MIAFVVALFNILLLMFPTETIEASKQGLNLWFNNVLPTLLPFIIGTNILVKCGMVRFIGTFIEPVMYPIFGVPGSGGFAFFTGIMSGYPLGAKTTAALRQSNLLTDHEAQRLISFANNSGPLFVIGAVGVGMFNNVRIGYFLLAVHYISAIITGLVFRLYKFEKRLPPKKTKLFRQAIKNMRESRSNESAGEMLGDSVKNAMESIILIGGYIILFSVIAAVLRFTNALDIIFFFVQKLAPSIKEEMLSGFTVGIIEMTNGLKQVSLTDYSLVQLMLAEGLICFGGLSIHAQSISFLKKTDIKAGLYILAKLVHGVVGAMLCFVAYPYVKFLLSSDEAVPVFLQEDMGFLQKFFYSSSIMLVSLGVCLAIIIVFSVLAFLRKQSRLRR